MPESKPDTTDKPTRSFMALVEATPGDDDSCGDCDGYRIDGLEHGAVCIRLGRVYLAWPAKDYAEYDAEGRTTTPGVPPLRCAACVRAEMVEDHDNRDKQ